MSVSNVVQIVRLAFDVGSKGISAIHGHVKEQQLTSKNRENSLILLLQKSAMCIQLGVEHLIEHIYSNSDGRFHDYLSDEWCEVLNHASLASGNSFSKHIAALPLFVAQVIPDLLRLMTEEPSESIKKSKELFQVAFLLSSEAFKIEVKKVNDFLLLSLASCLKICAVALQRLDNPDLMSMHMKSTVQQLEERRIRLPQSSIKTVYIKKCVISIIVLVGRFVPHFQFHNKKRLQALVNSSRTTGLLTLVGKNVLVRGELQTSFGKDGMVLGDLDGIAAIAMNSQGQLIVAEHDNGRVHATYDKGKSFVYDNPSIDDFVVKPVALAVDRNDNAYVIAVKSHVYVMILYGSNGKVKQMLNLQQCLEQYGPVYVCGMAIDNKGLIYVGNTAGNYIHVVEAKENSIILHCTINLLDSPFSFCIDPQDKLIVSQNSKLCIFKQVNQDDRGTSVGLEFAKTVHLKPLMWKEKSVTLSLTTDKFFGHVVVLARNLKTKKRAELWFVNTDPPRMITKFEEFPLKEEPGDCQRRVYIASGKSGLYWASEGANTINHILTLDQAMLCPL